MSTSKLLSAWTERTYQSFFATSLVKNNSKHPLSVNGCMKRMFLFLLLTLPMVLFAQDPADIFHKTIMVDSVKSISLDIAESDELEVKNWPGNYVLIETSVLMYNGQQNLMRTLKEEGRWDIEAQITGQSLELVSKEKLRPVMRTKRGMTEDVVKVVIYLPEDFSGGGSAYSRPL